MSGVSRVAVIVNANARRFVERPERVATIAALAHGRAAVHVTRSRADLAAAAAACRDAEADVVLLSGGDGSYGAGATALADAYGERPLPVLALGPGGTVGTVPRTLGLAAGGDLVEAFARLLHAAASGRYAVRQTPTLAVRADDGPRRVAFIFGSGLVARFFALYDAKAAARTGRAADDFDGPSGGGGYGAAAKIVARVFVESFYGGAYARSVLDPIPCTVFVDGVKLPWSGSTLVVASVIDDLGIGMRVTWRAGEDPLRPHVVVSGLPPRTLGPRMPRVLRGRPIGDPGEPHFDGLVGHLRLEFPGESDDARDASGSTRGGPFVVDGDVRRAQSVDVTAGPSVRLLRLSDR
jgi:hypothetical protein